MASGLKAVGFKYIYNTYIIWYMTSNNWSDKGTLIKS